MEPHDEAHAPESDPAENNIALRRVADPGELIAAIPAMLGFCPTRSLVVALLGTHPENEGVQVIGAVTRFDIDSAADPAEARGLAHMLESVRQCQKTSSTMAVVIDDRPTGLTNAEHLLRHLARAGIEPSHAWWVAQIATGVEYRDLCRHGRDGSVGDPRASTVAFAQVLDGHQIYAARHEIADLLDSDPVLAQQVLPYRGCAVARYRDDLAAARTPDRVRDYRRDRILWVLSQISTAEEKRPSAQDLATVAALLRDRTIRDSMYGLARSEYHGAAEALWRQIASATDGLDRAEAAALFAYSAYYYADTVLAGIAIATALDAEPTHAMAQLLAIALDEHLPPEKIRGMAEGGVVVAADLGLDIT
ncbi:DUF4192 domain-containing protein [Nocardia sp. NPDC058114]|uniref:DUF4192 domain-containing protein n=1 Tax=Nocardia sp. NPDC058114 TaxID=3346346 RepID=UPI0036DEEA77